MHTFLLESTRVVRLPWVTRQSVCAKTRDNSSNLRVHLSFKSHEDSKSSGEYHHHSTNKGSTRIPPTHSSNTALRPCSACKAGLIPDQGHLHVTGEKTPDQKQSLLLSELCVPVHGSPTHCPSKMNVCYTHFCHKLSEARQIMKVLTLISLFLTNLSTIC